MIGFLVFKAINDLKITVEVGLVVGTIPQTTPTGSAISVIPVNGSSLMIPTVFKWRKLLVTYSHANKFLTALSSNTPRPVSLTAASAKIPWWSSPATFYFLHNYCEIFHLYTTILHEKHTKNKHYRSFDVKKITQAITFLIS